MQIPLLGKILYRRLLNIFCKSPSSGKSYIGACWTFFANSPPRENPRSAPVEHFLQIPLLGKILYRRLLNIFCKFPSSGKSYIGACWTFFANPPPRENPISAPVEHFLQIPLLGKILYRRLLNIFCKSPSSGKSYIGACWTFFANPPPRENPRSAPVEHFLQIPLLGKILYRRLLNIFCKFPSSGKSYIGACWTFFANSPPRENPISAPVEHFLQIPLLGKILYRRLLNIFCKSPSSGKSYIGACWTFFANPPPRENPRSAPVEHFLQIPLLGKILDRRLLNIFCKFPSSGKSYIGACWTFFANPPPRENPRSAPVWTLYTTLCSQRLNVYVTYGKKEKRAQQPFFGNNWTACLLFVSLVYKHLTNRTPPTDREDWDWPTKGDQAIHHPQ